MDRVLSPAQWIAPSLLSALWLSVLPASGWAEGAADYAFGENLCHKAFSGILPNIDISAARTEAEAAGLTASDICGCAAQSFQDWAPEDITALRAEMLRGFQRQSAFDATLGTSIAICSSPAEGGDFSLGEALMAHTINCETTLAGDLSLPGFDLKAFLARMQSDGIAAEAMCGCSGSYYLDHFDALLANPAPDRYEAVMRDSLQTCANLQAVWPEATAVEIPSDPAYDPERSPEQICYAIVSGSLELDDFDYAAQRAWEAEYGLGPSETCLCATAVYDDIRAEDPSPERIERLAEDLIRAAEDCRRYLVP